MPARRTEHCWPVAHTLDDLLPLIPDPASFEVGSVLRIERIMLPDVHLQLVQEIARKFNPELGWQAIYLVANKYRAAEVACVEDDAVVIHTHRNIKAIQKMVETVISEGLRPLAIREGGRSHAVAQQAIELPMPVVSLDPSCGKCGLTGLSLSWDPQVQRHTTHCRSCRHHQLRSVTRQKSGVRRQHKTKGQYTRQSRTQKDYDYISQLRENGQTWNEIGKIFNRSGNAMKNFYLLGGVEGTRKRQQARAYLNQFDL